MKKKSILALLASTQYATRKAAQVAQRALDQADGMVRSVESLGRDVGHLQNVQGQHGRNIEAISLATALDRQEREPPAPETGLAYALRTEGAVRLTPEHLPAIEAPTSWVDAIRVHLAGKAVDASPESTDHTPGKTRITPRGFPAVHVPDGWVDAIRLHLYEIGGGPLAIERALEALRGASIADPEDVVVRIQRAIDSLTPMARAWARTAKPLSELRFGGETGPGFGRAWEAAAGASVSGLRIGDSCGNVIVGGVVKTDLPPNHRKLKTPRDLDISTPAHALALNVLETFLPGTVSSPDDFARDYLGFHYKGDRFRIEVRTFFIEQVINDRPVRNSICLELQALIADWVADERDAQP